ncbi:ubiquitin-conjugating enzyme E2 J1 [Pseudohyphozyma bogoriensis]|nr:ubiquitin-conjugating enzyme E2 J1 [Pseudohyphozyma bogoriensis]
MSASKVAAGNGPAPGRKLSMKSAGVRRLLQEAQELDEETELRAAPLEEDLFTWHFTIPGPGGDFEGGVYHGKMILPPEYPFKPPEVYMLTPSGRFEVNKKICLSISSFHPESWQPSWGIRTALIALSAFFASEPKGAVGSLDAPPPERRRLAKCSRNFQCAGCGFDASSPDVFPPAAETSEPAVETEPVQDAPSEEPTPIFPAPRTGLPTPSPSPHGLNINTPPGGADNANPIPAAPPMPVLQHRPPEPALVHHSADAGYTSGEGSPGGPLMVDRAILVVLLALLACIVRKLAGGTLIKHILDGELNVPSGSFELYALIRKPAQTELVKAMGDVTPLLGDVSDADAFKKVVVDNKITVLVETADAFNIEVARAGIEGLASVKAELGKDVYFFHTSGAKFFSSHTGVEGPALEKLSDTSDLYSLQKAQRAPANLAFLQGYLEMNTNAIDIAESSGVLSYTIVPPMVYGSGEGFGNKISIQVVALTRMAREMGTIHPVDETETTWALIHLNDLISLYTTILSGILKGSPLPHGRDGIYFGANGHFSWRAMSKAILRQMGKSEELVTATEANYPRMAEIVGCPLPLVAFHTGGQCGAWGEKARQYGWAPKYDLEHLMENIGKEVEFILAEDAKKASQ